MTSIWGLVHACGLASSDGAVEHEVFCRWLDYLLPPVANAGLECLGESCREPLAFLTPA
jgi:hypothetical protein